MGLQSVEPEAFFGYSEVHKGNQTAMSCGAGFYGEFTVSPIPTLTYAEDLRLHMPKNYTLEAVYVYDPEAPIEELYAFETLDDLKTLAAGSYYVALRITHTEGKNEYGYDYAFCLNVNIVETETPIALDLSFCEFALGHRLHVKFHPDGHLWILIGQLDAIHEIYKGTYVLGEGQITIDCPVDANYFGFSLHGTHTFESSEESVRIGELTVPTKSNDGTCPAVFVPLIMAYFDEYNASVPEYHQEQPEGYAVMDMDGDGTKEVVVKLAWDQKSAYDRSVVFFIDYDAEKILDHAEISYNHLYVDGAFSYTFDRTGPSYGVDKLVATETGYETKTLWRIYNDGSENAEYYIGDRKVTKEELENYTAEIECEKVTWNDCTWEITEFETGFSGENEGMEIVTENAARESLDVVYYVPKQGTIVILDFRPDHTVKITVQDDGYLPTDGWDIEEIFTGTYHLSEGFITLNCPEAEGAEVYLSRVMHGTFSFTADDDDDGGVWIGDAHFMLADERELDFLEYNRN